MKIVNACKDEVDARDYRFLEVFGVAELPTRVENNRSTIYDQSQKNDPKTNYACTVYGWIHCVNEANCKEAEQWNVDYPPEINPSSLWGIALKRGAKIDSGWSLQSATKLIRDLWHISWYTLCRSAGEVKQALANGQLVYTWSNRIDWKKSYLNNFIAVPWEWSGHAFTIFGYDDDKELFICRNSYWTSKWDSGYFYVKYDDYDVFFSKYAYADKVNPEMKAYRSKLLRERAFKEWLWNGMDGEKLLIRQDWASMAMRTGKLESTKTIWWWKNPMMLISRWEMSLMLKNATGMEVPFDIGDNKWSITRWEAAEWCIRIYNI